METEPQHYSTESFRCLNADVWVEGATDKFDFKSRIKALCTSPTWIGDSGEKEEEQTWQTQKGAATSRWRGSLSYDGSTEAQRLQHIQGKGKTNHRQLQVCHAGVHPS